ncbi:hypothetical protein GGI35DRAFT_56119 [Trichoderma velutinum]
MRYFYFRGSKTRYQSTRVPRQNFTTVRLLRSASTCLLETRNTFYIRNACMPSVSLRSSQIPLIKCCSERRDKSQECPAEHVASRANRSVKKSPMTFLRFDTWINSQPCSNYTHTHTLPRSICGGAPFNAERSTEHALRTPDWSSGYQTLPCSSSHGLGLRDTESRSFADRNCDLNRILQLRNDSIENP